MLLMTASKTQFPKPLSLLPGMSFILCFLALFIAFVKISFSSYISAEELAVCEYSFILFEELAMSAYDFFGSQVGATIVVLAPQWWRHDATIVALRNFLKPNLDEKIRF